MRKINNASTDFVSEDQKIMSMASKYNEYLFSLVEPYLKGEIIEIGSGLGNMTEQITMLPHKISKLYCVEPDEHCINLLKGIVGKSNFPIEIIEGTFPEKSPPQTNFADIVFSFNVMEHIEDDNAAIKKSFELLKPHGLLFCFVPAFQCLFGSMDKQLNHYRRYSKKDLCSKIEPNGFKIITCKYINFIGFWAWFFNNRILKITSQKQSQVKIFDSYILPIQAGIEKYIQFPLGQSIYIIAEKCQQ